MPRNVWTPSITVITLFLSGFISNVLGQESQCQPWIVDQKDRIFVLTDIANEPDDSMSLVRLLTHSDMYTVEGLVAITLVRPRILLIGLLTKQGHSGYLMPLIRTKFGQ